MSLKVAAAKAGIEATIPNYVPSGYKLTGPITYSPGKIYMIFASKSGSFTITQSKTDWDTNSLLNYIKTKSTNYSTVQTSGLSIYFYDGHASWINKGVRYEVEGKNGLSQAQVLKLVASL